MTRLKASLQEERGWALATAVMVTGLMLMLGIASFAYVDNQVKQSQNERHRESAFNESEGALNAMAFMLTRYWPGSAAQPMPDCSSATANVRCPSQAEMAKTFNTADFATGNSWLTQVRDNGGSEPCGNDASRLECGTYFEDSLLTTQPAWDSNGDGEVWIHAQGQVRQSASSPGKRVRLIARVSMERIPITVPQNVVTAASFTASGSPQLRINTGGTPLAVRCDAPNNGNYNNNNGCVELRRNNQLTPPTVTDNFTQQTAMPPSQLDLLRARAIAEGGHYQGCATNPTARVVFIESGNCSNSTVPPTTPQNPGILVIRRGTLNLIGNINFYGFIYMANEQNSCGEVFDSNGTHIFQGSIQVDGCGRMNLGTSSQTRLDYDASAFSQLYAFGNANLIRNSFRQLPR